MPLSTANISLSSTYVFVSLHYKQKSYSKFHMKQQQPDRTASLSTSSPRERQQAGPLRRDKDPTSAVEASQPRLALAASVSSSPAAPPNIHAKKLIARVRGHHHRGVSSQGGIRQPACSHTPPRLTPHSSRRQQEIQKAKKNRKKPLLRDSRAPRAQSMAATIIGRGSVSKPISTGQGPDPTSPIPLYLYAASKTKGWHPSERGDVLRLRSEGMWSGAAERSCTQQAGRG